MDATRNSTVTLNVNSLSTFKDPDVTVSDDNDEKNHTIPAKTKPVKQKKCNGRWSSQEQIIFLENLILCKESFDPLLKLLTLRTLQQIQKHTILFIQMCKKEFAVSKTKQQNKRILNHICKNYGFHSTENYLEQLEGVILNPSKEMEADLSEAKLRMNKTQEGPGTKKTYSSALKRKKRRSKEMIFSIEKKPKRSPNVINIVTMNVMINTTQPGNETTVTGNEKGRAKKYGPNPFNIQFDPQLMSSQPTKEDKKEKNKEESGITVEDFYEGDNGSDVDSGMNDYDSIN